MTGWMIGILLAIDGALPVRHFYAVAREDQARSEWAAADQAMKEGAIATSPYAGIEPIEALSPLSRRALQSLGVADDQVKALGWKPPRRWLTA